MDKVKTSLDLAPNHGFGRGSVYRFQYSIRNNGTPRCFGIRPTRSMGRPAACRPFSEAAPSGGRIVADPSRLRVFSCILRFEASCFCRLITRPPRAADDVQVVKCLKMSVTLNRSQRLHPSKRSNSSRILKRYFGCDLRTKQRINSIDSFRSRIHCRIWINHGV